MMSETQGQVSNATAGAWSLATGLLIGLVLGLSICHSMKRSRYAEDAIKAGVAEYQVNRQTGETKFVWIEPKELVP